MFKKVFSGAFMVSTILFAGAAHSQDFSGLYYHKTFSPELCDGSQYFPGETEGLVLIQEGAYVAIESQCDLTNPTSVRDMNATLFDALCWAEGDQYAHREMLMKPAYGEGIIMISDGWVWEGVKCPM